MKASNGGFESSVFSPVLLALVPENIDCNRKSGAAVLFETKAR